MILSKEFAVYLNLCECRLNQYTSSKLRENNVDLTPEQFLLLDLLWNQGSMTQQKIADLMHKDKNSITNLLNGLEKKKFVERRVNPNDKRSNIIVLTPKAQEMKFDAKTKGISMLDDILRGIPEQEMRSFLTTLEKIIKNMDEA